MRRLALTVRGGVLLVAGVLALLGAGRYELPALRPVAALLLGLVLLGLLAATVVPRRLTLERSAGSRVLDHGATAAMRLVVVNRSLLQGRDLVWRAMLPAGLGGPRRGRIAELGSVGSRRASVEVAIELSGAARGRHAPGVVLVETRDPFCLWVRRRTCVDDVEVVVLPRCVPLRPVGGFRSGGDGARTHRSTTRRESGDDDVVSRAYQPGDPPKRIDWRTSARRGELMVRQDEPASAAPMAVAVDPGAAQAPAEWAITAAASATTHLLDQGCVVATIVPGLPGRTLLGASEAARPYLVDLAGLSHGAGDTIVVDHPDARPVVVVLGVVGDARAREWVAALSRAAQVRALVAAESGETVLGTLRSAGWQVVTWDESDQVGTRWDELAHHRTRTEAPGGRA